VERGTRVAIGLPVYNGEGFLAEAIASILGQSYGDLRLVISDNCSTDGTQDICRDFMKRDDRIEYHRQERNIGGAPNYNFVFQPKGSEYFKWAAHDDILLPNFLEETVRLLDEHPDAVIAHGRSQEIDEAGRVTGDFDLSPSLRAMAPSQRLWRVMWAEYFTEVFALMRSDAIARTRLHGGYPGSDRNFMAEMLLLGNVAYSREVIFQRRDHRDAYVRKQTSARAQQAWFDPSVRFRLPPFATRTHFYRMAIRDADIPSAERSACYGFLSRWVWIRVTEVLRKRLAGIDRGDLAARISSRGLTTLHEDLGIDR
jgi:glycosyltransferase involved in cell wall biosynthesis